MQLAGVVRGCCKGPLGQPLQGKGGCYHLCCIGRIFVSMWEEDSLFSAARQLLSACTPEGSSEQEGGVSVYM